MRKGAGEKALEKIAERYPELNIFWLLTGEGEMMKSLYYTGIVEEPSAVYSTKKMESRDVLISQNLLDVMKQQADALTEAMKQNSSLIEIIKSTLEQKSNF